VAGKHTVVGCISFSLNGANNLKPLSP